LPDKILIVEDEHITAEDLAEVLKGLDYEVSAVAASGIEAIREVEKNPPDLVLMDIRIKGDMDGAETARILRERFDVPVVFLTAHADRDTLERAKHSRPMGYILKPFLESELHASVEIALSKHRHDRKSLIRDQHVTKVLGAMILGIISVDRTETVQMVNRAAQELTGWSNREAAGAPLRRVFRVAEQTTGKEVELGLGEAMEQRLVVEIRDRLLMAKNGDYKPIAGHIAPLRGPDGQSGGAVIMFEALPELREHRGSPAKITQASKNHGFQFGRFHIVAASEPMKQVLSFALRVAKSEASTVLLEGESGTGKDLLAQFLHYSSSRSAGPFVALNCSALPEALLETELFGREPGAYTDARTQKKGLLEVAQGGTIFFG
jgi:PAS domain S-box-containing protein